MLGPKGKSCDCIEDRLLRRPRNRHRVGPHPTSASPWLRTSALVSVGLLIVAAIPRAAWAVEVDDCRELLISGKYQECVAAAEEAISARKYGEDWPVFKAQAQFHIGQYSQALETVELGLKRYSWSVRLRYLGHQAARHAGNSERAEAMLAEIDQLAGRSPWRYTDADDLVTLGRVLLQLHADARDVLEVFYDRAKKQNPRHRDPYLASGQLAISKSDFALAADIFQNAIDRFPEDADFYFGLARALSASQDDGAREALRHTLTLNPNHISAMLFLAERAIDSEAYKEAEKQIVRALEVNPNHPEAWAYRAVIAHLQGDPEQEQLFRNAALSTWDRNPVVDHLIGRKLSQNYRFTEGAEYQQQALKFDPLYLPAQIQLAQDLLRLGLEKQGWDLANSVYESDGYDTTTFNLVELKDKIDQFQTLEDDDFVVRMDSREAEIYGQQVLALLHRAKDTLGPKYGLDLKHKTIVEIFPNQDDFAVRTFGMPAVAGFLGVCFGRVITANSPASQLENPSNWESVLWHEFCHVITLQMTNNKIPRWLSEGISVYEELQENPTWGQQMNPQYRKMILGGELTPLGELSSAFLSPPSGMHLQFAYYESSLAVEFIVERYGLATLKQLLRDLGAGIPINTALQRHTEPMAILEEEFEEFATQRANDLAPEADWTEHEFESLVKGDGSTLGEWLADNPDHFVGNLLFAGILLKARDWDRAEAVLQKLIEIYPDYTGDDNAYELLAHVYREQKNEEAEKQILRQYAAIDADAVGTYLRLIELDRSDGNWEAVRENCQRVMQVNPLNPRLHRAMAEAAEELNNPEEAIVAYRTLLQMEPADPAEIHYRLALSLHKMGKQGAKRHVLSALEEAPRYRAAHRLLLEISRQRQ